jgi:hypothetical protein
MSKTYINHARIYKGHKNFGAAYALKPSHISQCKICSVPIRWINKNNKWIPYELKTNLDHRYCYTSRLHVMRV